MAANAKCGLTRQCACLRVCECLYVCVCLCVCACQWLTVNTFSVLQIENPLDTHAPPASFDDLIQLMRFWHKTKIDSQYTQTHTHTRTPTYTHSHSIGLQIKMSTKTNLRTFSMKKTTRICRRALKFSTKMPTSSSIFVRKMQRSEKERVGEREGEQAAVPV